jgi:hypothetical protein
MRADPVPEVRGGLILGGGRRLPAPPPSEDPMTQRLSHRSGSGRPTGRRAAPPPLRGEGADRDLPVDDEPTILGFPAEFGDDEDEESLDGAALPVDLVVVRHPDRIGCVLLVLAGVAANVSLSLAWLSTEGTSGLSLVSQGLDLLASDLDILVRSGFWPPLVVIFGGGLLVLLGLLLLVPAHMHRFVGVLALLVSLATAAAVIVLLADAGWRADRFSLGAWFAVAVPVLGLLGALKAMLTPPHVTLRLRPVAPSV